MKFLRARGKNPTGGGLPEILLIMRLTMLFILLACLHVSAGGYAQGKISLTLKDVPLEVAFKAVLRQSGGYNFVGKPELLKSGKSVSLNLKDASLVEALNECFKGQPLTYEIQEKIIVVEVAVEHPKMVISNQLGKGIDGQVADEDGSNIAGATITVKGTKRVIAADAKGHFILDNLDPNALLVISCVGYETVEIPWNGKPEITIRLKRKTGPLDDVEVIAYGTTTQRYSTGDVTTVTAADIEKQPVDNPLLALQGRVPGLFITQATGFPGSGVGVLVQGQNSIQNGNDPFYVIDGVPYTSQLLPNLGSVLGQSRNTLNGANMQNGNPLSFINPSDIESISVLKDADATAIYGSRAANGAILITTKKGKAGQTKIDINLQDGWGHVGEKLHLLNTPEYLQMRFEALKNDGITAPSSRDYDINGLWDTTRYTDWQKTLIGGTAQYMNTTGTVSGGTNNIQYLVGGTYHRETTVFPGNFANQSGALHFSINSASSNQKFHMQLSGNYLLDNNQLPNVDLTSNAVFLAPDAPALYNKDRTLNWEPNSSGSSSWFNPLSSLYQIYSNKTSNLMGNAVLSYHVLSNLEIKSNFGYTNLQSNEITTSPLISSPPEDRPYNQRTSYFANNNINSWIVEPQIVYRSSIGKGKLEALIGTTIEQNNSNGQQLNTSGYNSDLVLENIDAATTVTPASTTIAKYKYNALFGRVNYNCEGKYILDLTERRDGSSRFGSANQFHDFGAIGGAWIFSKEGAIQNELPWMSFGKLRASYGTTGNDQIGDYQYLNLYSPNNVGVSYQGISALQPDGLPNPYLQWEETKKLQVGLDFGFIKDRILIGVNYFRNRSSNELLEYNLPSLTGFGSIETNFPATVQNAGWEGSLSTTNVKTSSFSWSSTFNLTVPRNKLLSFPDIAASSYASTLVLGQPLNVSRNFHFLGVDPATGKYQFADSHGVPTSNPSYQPDANVLLTTNPKYYGGFLNTFRYRGFQLDIMLQFTKQTGRNYFFGNGNPAGSENHNEPTSVLARWQKPGDITNVQRYSSNYNLFIQAFYTAYESDAGNSDASYIRLKNLSLSYQMPEKWLRKVHIENLRLYLQGQNLLTFTHYYGLDPETLSSTTLPPLRVITSGIQIGL